MGSPGLVLPQVSSPFPVHILLSPRQVSSPDNLLLSSLVILFGASDPLKVRSRRAGTFPSTFTAAPSATEVVTGCFTGRAASTWRGWAGPLTQAKAFCRLPSPGPGLASPYLRPSGGPRTSSIPQGFGLRSLRDAFAGHENTHLPGESFWGSRGGPGSVAVGGFDLGRGTMDAHR